MKHLRDKGWYFRAYIFTFLAFAPGVALVIATNNGILMLTVFLTLTALISYVFKTEIQVTLQFPGLIKIFIFGTVGFFLIAALIEIYRINEEVVIAIALYLLIPFFIIFLFIKHRHKDYKLLEAKLSSNKSLKDGAAESAAP